MEISKKPKITPDGPPTSTVAEERIWTELVPRLLHPSVLAIIQALLREGRPLSLTELGELMEVSTEQARYHCKAMARRRVLEVVKRAPRGDGEGDEVFYSFPKPPQAASPPSPASTP